MTLEYIHVTVHHACGHDMLRAVRSDDKATLAWVADGWMKDDRNCKHCTASALRAVERKMEKAGKL
jgi:hypothetical protein